MARSGGIASVIAVLSAAAAIALAGCASSDPPPRSPFQDDGSPAASTGTPRPLPTFTATPAESPASTATRPVDADAARERVVGEAIARLAEWTGVPETEVAPLAVEPVQWPSACLGAPRPDEACAEVVTPGYRIRLTIRGWEDGAQEVHASTTGHYRWAPRLGETVTLAGVDADAGTVDLGEAAILDGAARVVPGTYLPVPLAEFEAGDLVHVGLSYGLAAEDGGLVVWLIPAE